MNKEAHERALVQKGATRVLHVGRIVLFSRVIRALNWVTSPNHSLISV